MTTSTDGHRRHELARRGTCPTCGTEYQRLAAHWRGTCSPPAPTRDQRALVTGLLLGNGRVGGNGANKHFRLSTRWRPFAAWVYDELGWLAATVVRFDDSREEHGERDAPAQQYAVRTHAHPALTRFRAWYTEDGDRRLPAPDDLPGDRLTSRMGRAWHATAGTLGWSNRDYATTRQAYFSAATDDRAARVSALLESVGLDPTRAGKGVQLPPTQTATWLDWIGAAVPGVTYKWAGTPEAYRTAKHDAEALRARLWDDRAADISRTVRGGP